ncbi:MAG: cell division protein FtsA [Candidatus Niyogibacteria bacterium]|nr:cell division protein FtsA [Candidatus Niyogibacteria bacterium]
MAKNIVVGIDIGTSSVKAMVAEKEKGEETPRVLGFGFALSQGIRRGCVVDTDDAAEAITAALKDAEKASGISARNAYVSLCGMSLGSVRQKGMVMVSRADSEITEHDVRRAVEMSQTQLPSLANKSIVHTDPLYFVVDHDAVSHDPVGLVGGKLEVETLFTTGSAQYMQNLVKSMEAAGIAVDDIVAAPFAESMSVLSKRQKEVGVALINIGAGTTSIIVYEEGVPLSLEVFPVGSEHITRDIAIGFQLPMDAAEAMKCNAASESGNKTRLANIIEARLSDIFELADKHLKKMGRQKLLPAGVVITGGGANLADVAEFAKKELKLPAEVGMAQNIQSTYSKIQDPRWSVAAGLCLYGLEKEAGYGSYFMKGAGGSVARWFRSFLP